MTDDEIFAEFEDIKNRLDKIEGNLEVVYRGLLEVAKANNNSSGGIGNMMSMLQGMM